MLCLLDFQIKSGGKLELSVSKSFIKAYYVELFQMQLKMAVLSDQAVVAQFCLKDFRLVCGG